MRTIFLSVLFLLLSLFPLPTLAESACSPINYCQAEKTTFQKNKWKTEYKKELHIPSFCGNPRPHLQLEENLGIELWQHSAEAESTDWLRSQPRVSVNLHTYKLTYVVASGEAPITSDSIHFSHRLNSNKNTIIEVSCYKK